MKDFEEFLKQKHAEFYAGTDDNMPDDFERWLERMSQEFLLETAGLYGQLQYVQGKIDGATEAAEILKTIK